MARKLYFLACVVDGRGEAEAVKHTRQGIQLSGQMSYTIFLSLRPKVRLKILIKNKKYLNYCFLISSPSESPGIH